MVHVSRCEGGTPILPSLSFHQPDDVIGKIPDNRRDGRKTSKARGGKYGLVRGNVAPEDKF